MSSCREYEGGIRGMGRRKGGWGLRWKGDSVAYFAFVCVRVLLALGVKGTPTYQPISH